MSTRNESINDQNLRVLQDSIDKIHQYLMDTIGKSTIVSSNEKILTRIVYMRDVVTRFPQFIPDSGDQMLICLNLLVVPTMDRDLRDLAWETVLSILKYCITHAVVLLSWPLVFQLAFLLPGDKLSFEYPVIKLENCIPFSADDLLREISSLIQLIDPKSSEETIRLWWNFLIQHILPNIFKFLASKNKIIRRVSIEFMKMFSNIIDVNAGLWPFLTNKRDLDPIDCMKNLIQNSLELLDDSDQFSDAQVLCKFFLTSFPMVITCRRQLERSFDELDPTADQFALQIGLLLKQKVPICEILSWFDCKFSPSLENYLPLLADSANNLQQLYHVLLIFIFGTIVQYTIKFESLYDQHGSLPPILSPLLQLLLLFRLLYNYAILQPDLVKTCESIIQILLTMRFKTKIPLSIILFSMSAFDSKKLDSGSIIKTLQGTKNTNEVINQCFLSISSQIALTLSQYFFEVLKYMQTPISINSVSYERVLSKQIRGNSENQNLIFYFNLTSDNWDEKTAISFFMEYLNVADSVTNFQSSPKVLQIYNQISSSSEMKQIFYSILSHLLDSFSFIPSDSLEQVFTAIKTCYMLPDTNKIMKREVHLKIVTFLIKFIPISSEKVMHDLIKFAIDEIIAGKPFSFLMIPLIITKLIQPCKSYISMLEDAKNNYHEHYLRYISFITTMTIIKQPSSQSLNEILDFYKKFVEKVTIDQIRKFFGKDKLDRQCLQHLKEFVPRVNTTDIQLVCCAFVILIKQCLIDRDITDSLIAIICSFTVQNDPLPLVAHLLSIVPYLMKFVNNKQKLNNLIQQLKFFLIRQPLSGDYFFPALQALSDYIIFSDDRAERTELLARFYIEKDDDDGINEIIRRESCYLLKNIGKEKIFKKVTDLQNEEFIRINNDSEVYFGQPIDNTIDLYTKNDTQGCFHYKLKSDNDISQFLLEIFNNIGNCDIPETLPPFPYGYHLDISVFFRGNSMNYNETSPEFMNFVKNLGKQKEFVNGSNNKPFVMWSTTRLECCFQIVSLFDEKDLGIISENRIAIAWNEGNIQILTSDLKMPDIIALIRIKPLRNGLCCVDTISHENVGPINLQLVVPCEILVPLVHWTVFVMWSVMKSTPRVLEKSKSSDKVYHMYKAKRNSI